MELVNSNQKSHVNTPSPVCNIQDDLFLVYHVSKVSMKNHEHFSSVSLPTQFHLHTSMGRLRQGIQLVAASLRDATKSWTQSAEFKVNCPPGSTSVDGSYS